MMRVSEDTRITLLELVGQRARQYPHGIYARIPIGPAYSDGFKDVTNFEFYNAVTYTARLLSNAYGQSENFESLAYIAPTDLRYFIVMLAGVKAGYKVFLPSPRNSVADHVALLDELQCTKLAVTEPLVPCVPAILKQSDVRTVMIPPLEQLLEAAVTDDVTPPKVYADVENDPIFILHTSGSTGTPKPLVYTNGWVSRCFGSSTIPTVDGTVDFSQYITSGTLLLTLPPFHLAGVGLGLILALFHRYTTVYLRPGPPPTTEVLLEVISHTDVDWACVSPVVVDELGKRSDLLDIAASHLKFIFYAGGSVPNASGDAVAKKLPVWTILGSSEAGMIPLVHGTHGYDNVDDWKYMCFHPALKSEMRHLHDDFYELVLIRSEETESFQPVFTLFPAEKEFRTRDLFRPHPSKDGLWMYHSRIDDVIVFLNGEKTNPISFEHQVTGHPDVKAALVLGSQRFEAGLLIEPNGDADLTEKEKAALIDGVWLVVEKANEVTPAHARVARNKILCVDASKPMARAGKGTVQRAATLALYAAEIDQLYEEGFSDAQPEEQRQTQNVKDLIRNAVAEVLPIDDIDLFQLGMDSLGALRLQRALKKILPKATISNSTVYNNPSIRSLFEALEDAITTAERPVIKDERNETEQAAGYAQENTTRSHSSRCADDSSTEVLATVLDDFSRKIDCIPSRKKTPVSSVSNAGATVLLTGSTGAIGSYVLENLMSNSAVEHVYCLNRTADASERQRISCRRRGLTTEYLPRKVTFLKADLSQPDLGLLADDYCRLSTTVTHIIHNAWPVNFSLPLAAFTPSLEGVVSLVRFAANCKVDSSLHFYSSIASVFNYRGPEIPETIDDDLSVPSSGGYGQSKYVAERLIDRACKALNIKGGVVRIGQIAGAAQTANGWNRHEWLPSLIASSSSIGMLPGTLGNGSGVLKWVPIDHLAGILVELALASSSSDSAVKGTGVHHVEHPQPVTWDSILAVVKKSIDESGIAKEPVKVVPYGEWLSELRTKGLEAEQDASTDYATLLQNIPGLKLIDVYEELQREATRGLDLTLSTQRTRALSPSLGKLQPLRDEWVAGWVKDWLAGEEER